VGIFLRLSRLRKGSFQCWHFRLRRLSLLGLALRHGHRGLRIDIRLDLDDSRSSERFASLLRSHRGPPRTLALLVLSLEREAALSVGNSDCWSRQVAEAVRRVRRGEQLDRLHALLREVLAPVDHSCLPPLLRRRLVQGVQQYGAPVSHAQIRLIIDFLRFSHFGRCEADFFGEATQLRLLELRLLLQGFGVERALGVGHASLWDRLERNFGKQFLLRKGAPLAPLLLVGLRGGVRQLQSRLLVVDHALGRVVDVVVAPAERFGRSKDMAMLLAGVKVAAALRACVICLARVAVRLELCRRVPVLDTGPALPLRSVYVLVRRLLETSFHLAVGRLPDLRRHRNS
jgi:hypothetical protein